MSDRSMDLSGMYEETLGDAFPWGVKVCRVDVEGPCPKCEAWTVLEMGRESGLVSGAPRDVEFECSRCGEKWRAAVTVTVDTDPPEPNRRIDTMSDREAEQERRRGQPDGRGNIWCNCCGAVTIKIVRGWQPLLCDRCNPPLPRGTAPLPTSATERAMRPANEEETMRSADPAPRRSEP